MNFNLKSGPRSLAGPPSLRELRQRYLVQRRRQRKRYRHPALGRCRRRPQTHPLRQLCPRGWGKQNLQPRHRPAAPAQGDKRIGNVVLIIIDPVSAYLGVGKVDGRSATDVRSILTPLKDLAEEIHVAVIGIAHFNKKDDIKSALLRVSDSIAYVAAARHVYAVIDDPEIKDAKLFVKAKNNLAHDTKALRYGFGGKTVGYDEELGVDINAPYIVWH